MHVVDFDRCHMHTYADNFGVIHTGNMESQVTHRWAFEPKGEGQSTRSYTERRPSCRISTHCLHIFWCQIPILHLLDSHPHAEIILPMFIFLTRIAVPASQRFCSNDLKAKSIVNLCPICMGVLSYIRSLCCTTSNMRRGTYGKIM